MVDTNNPFSEDQQIEILVDFFLEEAGLSNSEACRVASDIWNYLNKHQVELRYK